MASMTFSMLQNCSAPESPLAFGGIIGDLDNGAPPRAAPAVGRHRVSTVEDARDLLDHRHGEAAPASVEGASDWSDFSSEGDAEDGREHHGEVRSMCSPLAEATSHTMSAHCVCMPMIGSA